MLRILFEHEWLRVGPDLTKDQFDRIVRWNERLKAPRLVVGHQGFRATQWVGVIQVGNLTLEILPKAERNRDVPHDARADLVEKWRFILLKMLSASLRLDLHLPNRADLHLQHRNFLDLFHSALVKEAQSLLHEGLVKTYRQVAKNRSTFRGRLVVASDLRENLVHRERVFTESMEFDAHNPWNRILVDALRTVALRAGSGTVRSRARELLLPFEDWESIRAHAELFRHLCYDRRTERYRNAMDLSQLILLGENPDFKSGKDDVFSLMFDMNLLWEDWVASEVRRDLHASDWKLKTQKQQAFWQGSVRTKFVKPDLVVHSNSRSPQSFQLFGKFPIEGATVLDTKWKVLEQATPSDEDLKQMFVYSKLWSADHTWLIYPDVHGLEDHPGRFLYREEANAAWSKCSLGFIALPERSGGRT